MKGLCCFCFYKHHTRDRWQVVTKRVLQENIRTRRRIMSNKGRKFQSGCIVFLFIYLIIGGIFNYLLSIVEWDTSIVQWGRLAYITLLFALIVVWFIVETVEYFKNNIRNMNSCGDKLFDDLDYYKIHYCGETKEHYQDIINAINFYYKEDGKVDTVIGNDLKRLYNRLEFLKRELGTKEQLNTCVLSVGLSICATILIEHIFENSQYQILYILGGMLLFFVLILFRNNEMFSYGYNQIYEYEAELLKKKIEKVEKSIAVEIQREEILLTKQNVLSELYNKSKFKRGKKRDDIFEDIRKVEKLDLNIQAGIDYKELNFLIGKSRRQGILFMKADNSMTNENYEILYKILCKHNILYEIQSSKDDDKK